MTTSLMELDRRRREERNRRLAANDATPTFDPRQTEDIQRELEAAVEGEVRFSNGDRALYATDASNYRQAPIGVVVPKSAGDVEATFAIARKYGAPILSRGGGTSLAGQTCNVAIVVDYSKYMRHVLDIDAANRIATVEPGCVLDTLRETAKSTAGLTFGPDPATHDRNTLGGMLGNDSCGTHSLMSKNAGYGVRTADNVVELEILTYRGDRFRVSKTSEDERRRIELEGGARAEIHGALSRIADRYGDLIRTGYPKLERRVSGYELPALLPENGFDVARALVGSEATCVTILSARLRLIPEPGARTLVVLGYPDVYTAGDHLEDVLAFQPTALEGMDNLLFDYVKKKGDENANLALLPEGRGFLIAEFAGASKAESDDRARRMMAKLSKSASAPTMKLYDDPVQEKMIWNVREAALGSTAWVPGMPDTWEGWEDSAVPVPRIGEYLRELRKLFDRYDYHPALYGHLGQGCVHCRVPFDLYTEDGIRKWRSFMEEATDLVTSLGGSYSGEHGDGQSRAEFLPKLFGPELMQAMRDFKHAWDPDGKMNPRKVVGNGVPVYAITENLRLGADYAPPAVETHFSFAADQHSFARAALRCVGIGSCRRESGGTMCPSYMVTHEEKHSTRGRARMLFEMLNGEVLDGGFRNQDVKEALDLCLSCKGCKGDCPVSVDMATYKSEFLAHHYEHARRPRRAYAFGWIHTWARIASRFATVANAASHAPGLSIVAKLVTGMDARREAPHFAPETFRAWFARRPTPAKPAERRAVLFPDTFNDFFHPETAKAAVTVLEAAGFAVEIPARDACCGRPLYDYGFLDAAKRRLVDLVNTMRPFIRDDVPIVVLEPSCWAVFKDELPAMLPEDEDAKRLSGLVYTLGAFLTERASDWDPPKLDRRAVLHGHCHQKSLEKLDDRQFGSLAGEKNVLKKMGVDVGEPSEGCCGMAGAFGFESGEHCDVSLALGERSILPRVRGTAAEDLVVADGFSCREQVRQGTERTGLHLAEVLALALEHGPSGPQGKPEAEHVAKVVRARRRAGARALGWAALALAAVVVGFGAKRWRA